VTRGLLFKRTLPITNGATGWGSPLSTWENLAKTSNKGLELTINSRNIITKDFKWNTSLTATWQMERIEELPNGDLVNENLFIGHAIKSIYDYKYAGIWGTDASQAELDTYGVKPGWVKIETVEKDGQLIRNKTVMAVLISIAPTIVRFSVTRIRTGYLVSTILSLIKILI